MAVAGVFDLELNETACEQDGSSDISDEEPINIPVEQVQVSRSVLLPHLT